MIADNPDLMKTVKEENQRFQTFYLWLEQQMPPAFYEEVRHEYLILIAHSLMGFHLQGSFININLGYMAFVLCIDSPDADLKILKSYAQSGIRNYQAYVSRVPPPIKGIKSNLRIGTIYFTEDLDDQEPSLSEKTRAELLALAKQRNPLLTDKEFDELIGSLNSRFIRSLSVERLVLVLDMFLRAKTRDSCQYEVRYNEDWQEKAFVSMQIALAWRNTPKNNFLYRLATVVQRHGLVMQRVNAAYINPYSKDSILVMALGLHGSNGQAAWEAANINDFLHELVTIKYFDSADEIDQVFVKPGYISGNMGNLLRTAITFIHQALINIDVNLYTIDNITEALCRHPELTSQICEAFTLKFDPWKNNLEVYQKIRKKFINDVHKIDTGHTDNDIRRKNVLLMGMNFVHYTLKTNFYRTILTAYSFRVDPHYLDEIPFDRPSRYPELPYGIFFIKGMHFFAFHIRFRDLSRGGVRTIYPEQTERTLVELNRVFSECYNLAYTQQKKNKDIPEGGAKAVIFVAPYDQIEIETEILKHELELEKMSSSAVEKQLAVFRKEQKLEYLHHAQRSFVESLITLVNCDENGKLRAKQVLDYWHLPEYIYLGPDENMHDSMIEWIANYSKSRNYKPGSSFISGKPILGINHKEYGVTSLGLNVYMEHVLKFLGIDPLKEKFTVKISGGPDGDVAGNQIHNLYRFYPKTAKILALTDVSGTIYDPQGLNLEILNNLFKQAKPIRFYPPQDLHEDGFLVDKETFRTKNNLSQQTLCYRKRDGIIVEEWLNGNDMNFLYRNNINQVVTDIFIPAGGRPKTLNANNVADFLDSHGKPTARAIIEGANLYLDNHARFYLEELGVLIIKDSSANKTGVICSSFEVLCGLTLGDEKFLENKPVLVEQILSRLKRCAAAEAQLLLRTHKETGTYLTRISEEVSERINMFTDQLMHFLEPITLGHSIDNPLIRCYLKYCLPVLREHFQEELLHNIPENHKKAIIACFIASETVYERGLNWHPTIADVMPVLLDHFQAH